MFHLVNATVYRSTVGRVEWNITGYVCSTDVVFSTLLNIHFPTEPSCRQQAMTAESDYGKQQLAMYGGQRGISLWNKQRNNLEVMWKWMITE